MDKERSTSGKYLSIQAVGEHLGDRLRLQQYRNCFADDAAAKELAVSLEESQTPALVDALLLRQWHQKYQPDPGPIKVDTTEYPEELLGDEMHESYAGIKYQALKAALEQRRKAVLVSL